MGREGDGEQLFSLALDWEDDARRTWLPLSESRVTVTACYLSTALGITRVEPLLLYLPQSLGESPNSHCERLGNHFPLCFAESSLREPCQRQAGSRKESEKGDREEKSGGIAEIRERSACEKTQLQGQREREAHTVGLS